MNVMYQSYSFFGYYLVDLRYLVVFDPLVHLVFHLDISGLSAWLLLHKLVVVAQGLHHFLTDFTLQLLQGLLKLLG
jgi:hypothetical protein